MRHEDTPKLTDTLATNPEPDTLSEPHPPLSPPGIPPQQWQIWPSMALGPKLNPRLGFQSLSPEGWPLSPP